MCEINARAAILAGCSVLWFSPSHASDTTKNYLDVSTAYSRGEFGTGVNTDLYRLQFDYGQIIGRYSFSITAPYLLLRERTGNESGLGDVNLQAGMSFNDDIYTAHSFYGSVSLKLPTADENKGLGTGKSDVGALLGYTGRFNKYSLTVTGGYIVTGDSSIQPYNDVYIYSVGLASYNRPWYMFARLNGQQRVTDQGNNPLELSGGFFYRATATQYLRAEVFTGLNDSSPNLGATLGVTNWF